jgi:hypothetical protein
MMGWAISIAAYRHLLYINSELDQGKCRDQWSIEFEIYCVSLRDSFCHKDGELCGWKMRLEPVMLRVH